MVPDKKRFEKLILASTSTYRKRLLTRLGVRFETKAPLADEEELKRSMAGLSPQQLAEALALAKAQSVADALPLSERSKTIVIGSDQLIEFKGQIIGKAKTRDVAKKQLAAMAGQSHSLITSVCLYPGPTIFTEIVNVKMRELSPHQIENYINLDNPLDCAGSYKIESYGIALMAKIEAQDYSSIEGLPLLRLSQELSLLGFMVLSEPPSAEAR